MPIPVPGTYVSNRGDSRSNRNDSMRSILNRFNYDTQFDSGDLERLRDRGISDKKIANWIKREEVPMGVEALTMLGAKSGLTLENLREKEGPKNLYGYGQKDLRQAGFTEKDIRKAVESGAIDTGKDEQSGSNFNLSEYDPASQGGKHFGLKDIEYLKSQGVTGEALREYAGGLGASVLGKRAEAFFKEPETDTQVDVLKSKNEELKQKIDRLKENREERRLREKREARGFLDKTIENISPTMKSRTDYEPKSNVDTSPKMVGGEQLVSPRVTYGGIFAPTMKAPITQKFEGGGDYGDISITSTMSPTYKNIGNVAAGVERMTGGTETQRANVSTNYEGIKNGVESLIQTAKRKQGTRRA